MKKIFVLFLLLLIPSLVFANGAGWNSGGVSKVQTVDGTTVCYNPGAIKANNGTVTCNSDGTATIATAGTNGGTVTTASVVSANGLAGSVANPTTSPAITLSTTVTGVLKGDGTTISAANSGTDYAPATTGTSSQLLANNGSGGFNNVNVGSGLSLSGGNLTSTAGGGSVTSITATSPLTGGTITGSGNIGINTTGTWNGNAVTSTTSTTATNATQLNGQSASYYYQSSNPSSYIALTGLSGNSPITYNNSNGNIGINTTGTWNGNAVTSTTATTATNSTQLNGQSSSYYYQSSNPNSYIALTGLNGVSPITYSNTTGNIGINTTGTWNGNAVTASTASNSTLFNGQSSSFYQTNLNLTQGSYINGDLCYWSTGGQFNCNASPSGIGTVTSIVFNAPLTGGTVTTTGNVGINTTGTWNGNAVTATNASTVTTINGQITGGSGVTLTGSGTSGSPYNIAATGLPLWVTGNIGINTTNNVGIGSINPGNALDVNGTIRAIALTSNGSGVGNFKLYDSSGVNWTDFQASSTISANKTFTLPSVDGTNGQALTTNGTGTLAFTTVSGGSSQFITAPNIGIGTTSNVGIGSLAPSATLDVQGTLSLAHFGGNIGIGTFNPSNLVEINYKTKNTYPAYAFKIIGDNDGTSTSGNNANLASVNINSLGYTEYDAVNNANDAMGIGMGGTNSANSPDAAYWITGGAQSLNIEANYPSRGHNPGFTVDSTNNVGIGSMAPMAALDVGSGSVCIGHICKNAWPSGTSQWSGTSPIYFNGNVGINTATPVTQFVINNASATATFLVQTENTSSYADSVFQNDSGNTFQTGIGGSAAALVPNMGFVGTSGTYPLALYTNNTLALVVGSTQNIGIGTLSPNGGGGFTVGTDSASVANATMLCNCSTNGGVTIGKCTGAVSGSTCTSCACIPK